MPVRLVFLSMILFIGTIAYECVLAGVPIKTNRPLVVIDPGHGGMDTGIISSFSVPEKKITLELSKKVAQILDEVYEVMLTRTNDKIMSAEERIAFANAQKADLYISLHLAGPSARSGFFHYFSLPVGTTPDPVSKDSWKMAPLVNEKMSQVLAQTFASVFSSSEIRINFKTTASPVRLLGGALMPSILAEPLPISMLPQNKAKQAAVLNKFAHLIAQSIEIFLKKNKTGA